MVITISRQFGSGGREIGRQLAERLKMRFMDREIIEAAASRLQPEPEPLTAETTLRLTQEVIFEAARAGNVLIVACGAQVLLAHQPHTVHIFVQAPRPFRMQRILDLRKLENPDSPALTGRLVDDTDASRENYLHTFYNRDWRDPELYDLMINSASAGIPGTVRYLEWWLSERFGQAA